MRLAATIALAVPLLCAAQPQSVPALLPPISSTPAAPAQASPPRPGPAAAPKQVFVGPYRVINWEELVPQGWDPMKEFRDVNLATLQDGDARAMQLLKRMREVWDAAPANDKLDGQPVRLPGFVVPLEETKDGLTEFLLVPYFGACIHTPPPPANQIVHVMPQSAARNVRSMDAVWISGTLRRVRTDSYMGVSTYRMDARVVEPYSDRK